MSDPDSEEGRHLKEVEADESAAGKRLDQWLTEALGPELSRNRVQALIRGGAVMLGTQTVTEPKRKVVIGERYAVAVPEPEVQVPVGEAIPLDILYEDDAVIVINKPAGLVVHPAPGNRTGTLVNALIHHCGQKLSTIGGAHRRGIVHRLDRDTSGVMVAAKTDEAHMALAEEFASHGRNGDLERVYVALVWGVPKRMAGMIDAPLGRALQDRTLRAVVPENRADSRDAVTHYKVLERYGEGASEGGGIASLVECWLETGRTHQVRVHLAHIGHPVIGDPAYGRAFRTKAQRLPEDAAAKVAALPRQALHARVLAFRHPETGEPMRFEAPIPDDLKEVMACLAGL
ncbi:RluA family pseudouridine synthase [Chelativorans sp. Marseille-P2723]|uniref:RluA family pseudouridine synthase n=1 Tax=Chelativorans sp. Marseille-P2723 TaxID=2709133 RepID=UPI00156DA1CE|nr:RluA family pseudouridine synthase [Chelativorans sp. Marseille-P2723]